MKKIMLIAVSIMFVLTPVALMAMSHEKHDMHKDHKMDHDKMDHDKMDHDKMDHDKMDHDKMDHGMHGGMEMLGSEVRDGVKATLKAKDTREAMAKMGMDHTHHLMVFFANEKSGDAIKKGTVAVKVVNPDETESKPIKMMGMADAFGADVSLQQKGMYHLYVGTKLADGKKRKYHFKMDVK
ncbi:MAG: hypothetical protein C0623_02685 [Desulfuromonas sp.]|nr:MAG: hypothetical protein C0623_02685 [Desulfuromonas sp.]